MSKADIARLKRAAKAGETGAQLGLAARLAVGDGVFRDEAAAVHWYGLASKGGSGEAAFNLATMYARGEGIRASQPKAMSLYRRAERLGSGDASITLGELALRGHGGSQSDPVAALFHFATAAAHHDVRGLFLIASTLAKHPSVSQSELIKSLLQACADAGHREAKSALRRLKRNR